MLFKTYSITLIIIFIFFNSCNDNPTSPPDNEIPMVSILYPANNSELMEGTTVIIKADAFDNEGIKEVKFYIDGEIVETDISEPYHYEWNTIDKSGSHIIKVKAFDKNNNIGVSNTILVIISKNTYPIASFTISPSNGSTTTTFQFDASSSSDSEDKFSQLKFSWDWENDGIWDIESSTNYNLSHRYNLENKYTVRMKVMDSGNFIKETLITLNVYNAGTVTDIDGNVYQTVKIGDQWWMAENLKVTRYRNGDVIPNVTNNYEWGCLGTGAYCSYNNDNSNITTYGLLYNCYAVDDSRNISPEGWHVPADDEWQTLINYLGGKSFAGGKLKEADTNHWESPNTGATNERGFKALPGGLRHVLYGTIKTFDNIGTHGYWWSSRESSSGSWGPYLSYNSSYARDHGNRGGGFSVRCIRD